MPLDFTGRTNEDVTGVSIQATDSGTGKPVVVRASHEVIQDKGLPQVKEVASNKYDVGNFEPDGSISVRDADFAKGRQ